MKPIAEVAGQELAWVQPSARKREHELRAGADVVATMRFERGTLAHAQAADGEWTFKRQGFWHPRVTVRLAGSDNDIAVFHPRWAGGGQLAFADGRAFRLSSANLWQTEWTWQEQDQVLMRFMGRHPARKTLVEAGYV